MFSVELKLNKPGLFVTGTDTAVGKTVVTCAIASCLRGAFRVGVCKPLATGCREVDKQLLSEDAQMLSHHANADWPLEVINPIRFREPLAPAVAAQRSGQGVDFDAIAHSLVTLDRDSDVVLVEGVGGLLVPIDPRDADLTVLDLIRAIGYPVLVVARAGLGTLNHTAMTAKLLRDAGCRLAGLVVNHGAPAPDEPEEDPSIPGNRQWLERMTHLRVLAILPQCGAADVTPKQGHLSRLPQSILDAVAGYNWPSVMGRSSRRCH